MCDVTLSVYPHRAGLKNMPGHGGNRTYEPTDSVAQLAEHWARNLKVVVRFPPWPGIFFKPARCGYTLRVTSHKQQLFRQKCRHGEVRGDGWSGATHISSDQFCNSFKIEEKLYHL